MDFFTSKENTIGSRIDQVEGGYDHCFVIHRDESKKNELTLAARLTGLKVRTNSPYDTATSSIYSMIQKCCM